MNVMDATRQFVRPDQSEGELTKSIEKHTASIPSST